MANESIFGLIAKEGVPNSLVIDLDDPTQIKAGYPVFVQTDGVTCNYRFAGTVTHLDAPANNKIKAIATVFFLDKVECERLQIDALSITVSIFIPPTLNNPQPIPVPAPAVTNKVDIFDIP